MVRIAYALLCILLAVSHSSAQFYYFGRNKVQYTDFQWHVLKTEHFDIYFYPEMKDLAERGALVAEESYRKLEQRFNHNISSRIPLIFYSSHLHFQQTNVTPGFIPEGVGGFFEFLKGRVVIPSNGSSAQFAHVIRHELVHVFMHSKINRVLLDHRKAQDRLPPLWFTEGLAEFWSTTWDTQAEMVMRDAVLSNIVVPLSEMERIYGSFLMYKEGQSILEYIAQRYGDEKILLLMENFWKSSSFSQVMKITIGKDYKEFDEEWLYFLKKRYYPQLAYDDLPSLVTKKILDEGFNSKPVFHQTDGVRYVYFMGNHVGYTNLYRLSLDQEKPDLEVVVPGERTDAFEAFHPFHSKIDVSADGILAFVTKSGENDALHLYDIAQRRIVESLRFRNLVMITSPSWAPDGTRLVFASIDKSGNNDLYIFDLKRKELLRLTNDFYDDRDPAWSPDGRSIVFSSDRSRYGREGKYNLFEFDLTSGSILYRTFGDENYSSPVWSPDGRYLTFVSDRGGGQNIWLMNVTQSADGARDDAHPTMRRLTNFFTAGFDPTWDDRGGLLFTVFENFSFQIRSVSQAEALFDSSDVIHTFSFLDTDDPWELPSLKAESGIEEFRYTGKYNLDIAQSQISTDPIFGTSGGAALAMSDMLGNDIFYFLIYNTAQSQDELLDSFNIAMSRISLGKRANHSYGIFHFSGYRYDLTDPNIFYYERAFGGYFALSYPLSRFRRVEANVVLSNSDKDIFTGELPRRALLVSNAFSFVWANSLWGPTGPIDGNRFKATFAFTTDVTYSNVGYYTVIADYRKYFRLGVRATLASRAHVWFNEGKESRRFFMGGSWDLRGWPRWSIRGQKLWLTSHELRFPFVDELGVRFPFGGIRLGSIRGALYIDAGSAWDKSYVETKGSVGMGLRMNVGGFLVLRYDVGKRIEENFATLQKGLYYQFFFGWDF